MQSMSAHCPPNSESGAPDCIPAASWLHPRWPWQRLKNPLGRSLVSALNPTLEERRKGIHLRLQRIDKAKLEFVNHL